MTDNDGLSDPRVTIAECWPSETSTYALRDKIIVATLAHIEKLLGRDWFGATCEKRRKAYVNLREEIKKKVSLAIRDGLDDLKYLEALLPELERDRTARESFTKT